jgi:putative hydrolase of the HAD superfamily
MFPFDVILFDVGGVLLTNGWDTRERALAAEHFHIDLAELEAKHHSLSGKWERGLISRDEYLDGAVFYQPRSFTRNEFFNFVLAQSQWLPNGAIGILKQLVASNICMVGALNNEARETNEYRFATFGLRGYFKVALSSCYLGLRKPDLAIYERALDILGRPQERILFIDDREENVAGALDAGMKAIQFKNEDQLRREFASLGL